MTFFRMEIPEMVEMMAPTMDRAKPAEAVEKGNATRGR